MNGVADQLMPAVAKSSSLRELYFGENPWKEQDWKSILSVCQKPSNLHILGLGMHTYLTEDCVKVNGLQEIRNSFSLQHRLYNISIPAYS